ncbi:MAG: glycosyltransferase, partial [Coriobacteriia bacterium]|nr:glycosyltransferase [Coriobacteriia bacterium]
NHFFVPPTPLHAAWQRRAEARTASRAAALVTVSPAIADDLSRRYPGTRVELIPNGFDPEDLPRAVAPPAGRFVLVHAGTFSGPRSPRAFLEGLVLAERREPALADVAEVRFVGVGAVAERLARQAGVRAAVATTGFVPYPRALEEAASASVNVAILSPGEESRHSVPGKLAEYVGLRRPILLLAGQGAARDVLAGVAGVRAAAPDDPSDIASAVLDLYHAWREGALRRPAEEEAARFSRVETARRYAELLDDVAARAGAEEA